jgi:hypothetical protein
MFGNTKKKKMNNGIYIVIGIWFLIKSRNKKEDITEPKPVNPLVNNYTNGFNDSVKPVFVKQIKKNKVIPTTVPVDYVSGGLFSDIGLAKPKPVRTPVRPYQLPIKPIKFKQTKGVEAEQYERFTDSRF